VGAQALYSNTTVNNNTAVGYEALEANTTGTDNTAVGAGALQTNTTGNNNTAIGQYALSGNTESGNTAVGFNAGTAGGTNGTFIGYGANATGAYTNATAIGYDAYVSTSNALVLGSISGQNPTDSNWDTTTYVGIGTSVPATMLHVSSGVITLDGSSPGLKITANSSTNSAGYYLPDAELANWFSNNAPVSGQAGEEHYCISSAVNVLYGCSHAMVCVSTGTMMGQWAAVTGNSTTPCN
jgi:hypothetical protein